MSAILSDLSTEEIALLPKKTILELSSPAGEGDRRTQVKRVAVPMIANGFGPDRVFQVLRDRYDSSFRDDELRGIIQWVVRHSDRFQPSGKGDSDYPHKPIKRQFTAEEKMANAERYLDGFRCTVDDLIARSPTKIHYGEPRDIACLFLISLYSPADLLNVVTDFMLNLEGKPCPRGGGETRSVYQWRQTICANGVPHSDAGCKFRLNPVRPANLGKEGYVAWRGSGYSGSYTDGDVERAAYVMLESDCLSLEMQASMLARVELPIAAIIDTGGKSLHADIKLTAGSSEGRLILENLYALGFDQNNSSPSRLERMPGDIRKLGARDQEGTEQRLVYLNSQPEGAIYGSR